MGALVLCLGLLCLSGTTSFVFAATSKGTGIWTLYYVAEMEGKVVKSGGTRVKTQEGGMIRVQVSPRDLRKANLEGTVAETDLKGKRIVTNILKRGLWQDLPDDWEGMGNRSNPLATYRSVAADPQKHRYGSRIFVKEIVGFTPPGFSRPHDGYLWIADTGGGIKGWMRFDLFVGPESTYKFIMKLENEKGKWRVPTEYERLPSSPRGYSPKTDSGLRKIMGGLGLLKKDGSTQQALIAFQKQHHHIPKSEYGSAKGAVSLWYLTQAAIKVSKGASYDATAAQKRS